jgi:hypothetical protein
MQKLPIAILQFATSAAAAQSQYAASKAEVLSLDQETRISQLIVKQAVPLPAAVSRSHWMPRCLLRSKFILSHRRQNNWRRKFAASATSLAEGQTALVDQRAHKVEIVFARRGAASEFVRPMLRIVARRFT